MSTNQNNVNKGNQKAGTEDQRRKDNEKRDPKNSEQSRNDKKHLQQSQRRPRVEFGTSKVPASETNTK